MKTKLSDLIRQDTAGYGFLSAYGWTCSKCVLQGFAQLRQQGEEIPDSVADVLENTNIDELRCECVAEKNLIEDDEGLRLLRDRDEGRMVIDDEAEDIERPKLVEVW